MWHALRSKDTGARCVIFVVRCAGKFVACAQALVVVHSEGLRLQYMCTRNTQGKQKRKQGNARNSPCDSGSHKSSNIIDTKVPPETLGRGFQVHPFVRIDNLFAPFTEVVPMAFLFADVEVLRLAVPCVSKDKCLWIQPYRADLALPQRKAAGESDDDIGLDDHGRSRGSDGKP